MYHYDRNNAAQYRDNMHTDNICTIHTVRYEITKYMFFVCFACSFSRLLSLVAYHLAVMIPMEIACSITTLVHVTMELALE